MPAMVENRRTARPLTSDGCPRTVTMRTSSPPIQTPLAAMWAHCAMRLTATGACAPAWLAATSTHIEAAAPMAASVTAARFAPVGATDAAITASPVAAIAATRSIAVVPNDVENNELKPTPAASRCASTTPAMPSVADDPGACQHSPG